MYVCVFMNSFYALLKYIVGETQSLWKKIFGKTQGKIFGKTQGHIFGKTQGQIVGET